MIWKICPRPSRSVPLIVAASVPSASRATTVVNAPNPDIQSRMRPGGYHSRSGATLDAPLADETLLVAGRPSKTKCPSHQAGVATATRGNRTTRKTYGNLWIGGMHAADQSKFLANDVGQQAEETRALDRAREFALLLGRHGGDAARHDLAALGDVTHQQLGIL